MKKLLLILFSIILLSSCTKQEEPKSGKLISFGLKIKGYELTSVDFKSLDKDSIFNAFKNIYAPLMGLSIRDYQGKSFSIDPINGA